MAFWDASAVVPLVVPERSSDALRARLDLGRASAVWWGTRVEVTSALRRREREGVGIGNALGLLADLAQQWVEIQPGERIRATAERLLAVHPLRSADAIQLAAAISGRGELTRRETFVCLDERLRDAAAREGFELWPESLS